MQPPVWDVKKGILAAYSLQLSIDTLFGFHS